MAYKLIACTTVVDFEMSLEKAAQDGWKVLPETFAVTPHHDRSGYGMQYSALAQLRLLGVDPIKPAAPSTVPGNLN